MPKANCTFSRNDVKRAVLAATGAGLSVSRVEFSRDGLITIHTEQNQNPAQVLRRGPGRPRKAQAEPAAVATPPLG